MSRYSDILRDEVDRTLALVGVETFAALRVGRVVRGVRADTSAMRSALTAAI